MSEFADAFRELKAAADELNEATNATSLVFKATEDRLNTAGIGAAVAVVVSKRIEESPTRAIHVALYLVYDRIGGKFRIGFQEELTTHDLLTNVTGEKEFVDPIA